MDKKKLQTDILEARYQPEQWLEVLKLYFGAKKFHQTPQPIILPSNDLAEMAAEIGSFYTADERLIGIYEVKLTAKAWISKNRVGLRNLLRQVYKYDVDGALIVFVQDSKWRFSYVSEIRTEEGKKETEPKRYTYLFGKGESCRTAADRFDKLKGKPIYINDLYDAFSVEKLNKDFFKTYKEFYEKFWKYLAADKKYYKILADSRQTDEEKKQKPLRDFSKKLLGRIVFLQFLQKKGWMGVSANSKEWKDGDTKFLQTLFATSKQKDKFHSTALKTLFFETLNTKRKNDLAPASIGDSIKLPYLNGGLFDKDIAFENDFDFPVDYFETLLDFFEQNNFTIDENDPYDSEVGIDPEMLGHIFENLLEENREKGAFYTPKEIVHYMCQESLIEYLQTQLPNYEKADFDLLIRSNQVAQSLTAHKKAIEVNEKLKAVKVCDPAIGSGAFPMGLLKEIFECRRLLYPYLKTNEKFDPAQVKKDIIQENIYGVDLENGAVEIARLRFWLALVVDETGPQPLPNLDYKIMQGNSLLERFGNMDLQNLINADDDVMVEEKKQLTLGDDFEAPIRQLTVFTKANKEELFTLIKKYFDPDEWEKQTGEVIDKAAVKRQINDFVEGKIHAFILKCQRDLNKDIKAVEKKWKDAGVTDHSKLNQKSKEYKQYTDWKKQLDELDAIEEKLVAIQKSDDKPYFLWHLWFKDVFDKGGFDIMIGNPPYIQLQKMTDEATVLQEAGYDTFTRTGDIYCLFYEQGNKLLKAKGNLCYITSNTWMRTKFGEVLRRYFATQTNPIELLNFEDTKIFQTATVETNIILFKKESFEGKLQSVAIKTDYSIGTSINDYLNNNAIVLSELSDDGWIIADKKSFEIKKRIEFGSLQLKDLGLDISRGIVTGLNEAFVISSDQKNSLQSEDLKSIEVIKPFLGGRNIHKYKVQWDNEWLLYMHSNIKRNEYSAVIKHLIPFKEKLESRRGGMNTKTNEVPYQWWQIQVDYYSSGTYKNFEKPKLMWAELSDKQKFVYDESGFYPNKTIFIITGDNLKYLLIILNSKLIAWYFDQISTTSGMGTTIWSKYKVEQLPIPKKPTTLIQSRFELLADYLQFLNDEKKPSVNPYTDNASIAFVFEDVVNMMVYELYFEEHMKQEEIDVLQFVNEKSFPMLGKDDAANAEIIGKSYKTLQEQENPIRNRVILSNIRSKDIIRRINSTTH
ncbi:MAG: TaqI-like C-terminal specificity domain-containing protein [Bacteroidota bacterium]